MLNAEEIRRIMNFAVHWSDFSMPPFMTVMSKPPPERLNCWRCSCHILPAGRPGLWRGFSLKYPPRSSRALPTGRRAPGLTQRITLSRTSALHPARRGRAGGDGWPPDRDRSGCPLGRARRTDVRLALGWTFGRRSAAFGRRPIGPLAIRRRRRRPRAVGCPARNGADARGSAILHATAYRTCGGAPPPRGRWEPAARRPYGSAR